MADRAPSLDDLLASSTPSLDDLIAAPAQSNFDFSGARTGNAAPRAVTSRLANPNAERETEERNQRDRARQSKPIEADSELERVGVKFWQRIRGMGAGGGRLAGAALEELGFDPNGEAAQWLRTKSQSGEEYSNRPVEGETTWDALKKAPSIGGLARYVIEQAGSSTADMLSLSTGAGIAPYVALQAGSTGQQRAQNNNELDATAEDIFTALPSAIGSAALERLGIHGIFGAGAKSVVGRIAQAFGTEALTEALQSPVEYAGSNLGTKAGFDPMEALDQAAAGAVAGGAMGGAIRAGIETPGAIVRRLRREETGAPAPAGVIEQAEVTPVTAEDEASPLPTDLIAQGKAIAGTSTAATDANGILSANGAPAVGSKVSVTVGGKTRTGTIRDAFVDESDAELGAQPGLNIDLDGGGQMREYFADLRDAGVTLEQVEQAQRDIAAADLTPSETLDAIAETGETPAAAAPEAVPTLDDLTAAAPVPAISQAPRARAGFDVAGYMGRARQAESGGNDGASNTRSSASGRYQFTDGTFAALYRKVYGADAPAGAKNDPAVQERLMERFTADNAAGLRKAGVEVNDATVYAAHHFGLGGALDMVRNPTAAVDPAVVKANPQFRGMTNAEALAWTARHIGAQQGRGADAAPIAPVELDENDRPRLSDEPLSTTQVEAPARAPDPEPADTTEAVVSDQPASTATLTETPSGKGVALAGASEAEMAAIAQAIPNARSTPNKDGALVYSAKYRPQIEAVLSASTPASTATAEPPVPEGMRRVYHSGSVGAGEEAGDSGRWVSTNRQYASDYRPDTPLFYTDLPASDPRINDADYPDQTAGTTFSFETTPEEATRLREISRDAPATPAREPAPAPDVAAATAGYADTAVTSTGREVPVRYKVVEASDLIASNDAEGNPNPAYPQNLQPRDRTRGASVAQVTDIAANLNPRLLGRSVKASDGAPIVSAGNVVESGNGRTLALRRAYESNGPQAERYREFLRQEGFDTAGFRQPVLVRERGPMADADVEAFTREANARDTLGYSATEQGVSDAKAMTPGVLDLFRGGELDAAGNRDFVRAFLGSVVPQSELSQMVASDGSMSQAAVARVRGALLARAYSSEKIVADAVEATDTDVKAIVGALTDVAGRWAQMTEAAKDGRIEPAMDLTKNLTEAVALVSRARREGRAVADLVGQTDMFGGSLDARTEALLRLFFNKADFTKPAARQRVAERLSYYVDEALKSQPGGGLFGEQTSPDDVVALAQRKGTDNGGGEQSNLFGPGTASAVAAEPARGAADAGPRGESVSAPDRGQAEGNVARQRAQGARVTEPVTPDAGPRLETERAESPRYPETTQQMPGSRTRKEYETQGWNAAEAGWAIDDNPYYASSTAATAWDKGFRGSDKVRRVDKPVSATQRKRSAPAPTQQAERDPSNDDGGATSQRGTPRDLPLDPAPATEGVTAGETAPTYGASNKLVSVERATELRAKLKAKMNQLNSGIDPEVLALGTELAVFHIEAGARKFGDFSRRMIADIGESVRPFLRSFYEAARYYPGVEAMAREMDTAAQIEEEGNAANRNTDLEPDRQGAVATDTVREADIPAARPEVRRGAGARDGEAGGGRRGRAGARGVSDGGAAPVGEGGDQRFRDGSPRDAGRATDAGDGERSGADGFERPTVEHVAAEAVDRAAANAANLERKAEAQRRANAVAVKPGDRGNIAETLPYLHEGQQDDVLVAETRFAKPDGHGVLFTNGTGTGKTFSGAGIIARMVRQGQGNHLVLAPSQDILRGWVDALDRLGVPATILNGTDDAGSGVSLTTYANAASNNALASRVFDLVTADEAHKLSSNQDGETTTTLEAFRAFTNHPRGLYDRARRQLGAEWKPFDDLERRKATLTPAQANARTELAERTAALAATFRSEKRVPVVMLSATPFAYVEAVDYAEGYLFNYPEVERGGYNQPNGRQQFFIQNFGYRMRTGKLTKPDAGVDSGVMEREFHELLKREGALSGRVLDVDADYDRKFVLVDDAVGNDIDRALEFLSSADDGKFRPLHDLVSKRFDYLSRMRLLEAIKATHAVDMIRQYHSEGRKVVVFHDYNEGGGFSPFRHTFGPGDVVSVASGNVTKKVKLADLYREFLERNPYVDKLDFSQFASPIVTLQQAFPDALIYNGGVPAKERTRAKVAFNQDGPGTPNLIVIQSAAGEAGISLHDTTGKHMRMTINLGMPVRPTTAIQEEGRTYRDGQVTNASFRYLNTGTAWERWTFAGKIAERAGTAENLALGSLARSLKQSFIDSFSDSQPFAISSDDGVGGKQTDRANNTMSPYERAKTYYWAQQKQRGGRNQREGVDYFPTPEPVGFKMVELAGIKFGERVLEPSAGHGAIARFLPESADRTLVEPSADLISRAALASPGARTLMERFEDMHVSNKFDAIVMNPPYGVGGKTAIEHLAKAGRQLRNGGRVVALIPTGPAADKRFNAWQESEEAKALHLVADIKMPSVTFERAGTAVATRVVVIEKQTDADVASKLGDRSVDLTDAKTVNELFDRMEGLSIPARLEPITADKPALPTDAARMTVDGIEIDLIKTGDRVAVKPRGFVGGDVFRRLAAVARQFNGSYQNGDRAFGFDTDEARRAFLEALNNGETGQAPASDVPVTGSTSFDLAETTNAKTGAAQYVATPTARVERTIYDALVAKAKQHGGWYSYFRGKGAVPGFQFKSAAARDAFVAEMAASADAADAGARAVPDGAKLSVAEGDAAPNDAGDLEAIRTQLAAEAKRMGLGEDRLTVEAVGRLLNDPKVAGMYLRGVISVAAEANADPRRTLDHEFIHALRDMGLFRPAEWTTLERAARADTKLMAKAQQLYPELDQDGLAEEAVARMFENWKGDRRGFMGAALGRIADVIAFVRRLVSKVDTAGDIMRRINRGEVGAREAGDAQADAAKLSIIGSSAANPNPTTVSEAMERARTFVGRMAEGYENWRVALQDRMLPVLRAEAAVERVIGRELADSERPYLAEELMAGRTGAKIDRLADELIDPMWAAMEAEKISTDELESYLYAKHAPERNAYIASVNPDFAEGEGSGMTDIEAAAILSRIDRAGRTDAFERVAERVYRVLQFARDERHDAGLLSDEQLDSWNSAYQFYVPLRGFAELDGANERPNQGGSGLTVRGAESKRAFGRRSRADDILAHTIMQAEEAIVRGEKNRVAQAFYDLAKAAPDADFWETNKVTMQRRMNPLTGLVESYPVTQLMPRDEPMTVSLKVGGKERRVTMNARNPEAVKLAAAMRRLDEQQTLGALVVLSKMNRFLSTVNTSLNPEFIITNAFRDIQTAAVNLAGIDAARIQRGTLKDWRAAMAGATRGAFGKETGEWGRWWREFTDAGGRVAYNQMQDLDALRADMAKRFDPKRRPGADGLNTSPKQMAMIALGDVKAALGFIDNLNTGIENGVRLAAYKNAREAGLSPARAASIAKNLTVNFNRRGTKGAQANALYLFYNASIQGTARMLMALRSPKVQKIVAGIVVAGAGQELLNMMLSGDDDDGEKIYDKIPEFEKQRNMILMVSGPWGDYLKLPMPWGYNAFHSLGRNMVRLMRGQRAAGVLGDTLSTFADAFNPLGSGSLLNLVAPTFVDPAVDLTLNRDFADRPIMPDENKLGPKDPDNQRYWNNVSPVWKEVASLLNEGTGGDQVMPGAVDVSPETMEYLFGVVTGATGAFVDRTAGALVKAADGDPATELGVNDVPLARKVIGSKPTWYDKAAFYARLGEVDQAVDYAKGYGQRVGKEALSGFVEKERPLLGLMPLARAARSEMSEVRQARNQLELARDRGRIDDATYRARMEQVKQGERKVVTAFNRAYLKVIDQPLRP